MLILYSDHIIIVLIENVEMGVLVGATLAVEVRFARAAEVSEFAMDMGLRSFEMDPAILMYVW